MFEQVVKKLAQWALPIGLIVVVGWVGFGFFLFLYIEPYNYAWSRGEVGDFLSGLGGFALILVGPTAAWQYMQLKEQQKQNHEAGALKIFETLKPELENLSVRIFAKSLGVKGFSLPDLEGETFESLRKRFWDFDRTLFLRQLQKEAVIREIEIRLESGDKELIEAVARFRKMMIFLESYVSKTDAYLEDDFKAALKSTEVFQAYEVLSKSKIFATERCLAN